MNNFRMVGRIFNQRSSFLFLSSAICASSGVASTPVASPHSSSSAAKASSSCSFKASFLDKASFNPNFASSMHLSSPVFVKFDHCLVQVVNLNLHA